MFFWAEFTTKRSGTISAKDEAEARTIVAPFGTVKQIRPLPYPALPYLNQIDMPDFCYEPGRCAGHTACPQRRSCTD